MKRDKYRDIIIIGSVGLSGAMRLASEHKEEIGKRFPGHVIRNYLSGAVEEDTFADTGITLAGLQDVIKGNAALHDSAYEEAYICEIGGGGLMKALWDMGESLRAGFEISASKIPVVQLSIEICELFGADPLKLESFGCFLLCTTGGNPLLERLESGLPTSIIGHTTDKKGKVMVMGEVCRYIDKPR